MRCRNVGSIAQPSGVYLESFLVHRNSSSKNTAQRESKTMKGEQKTKASQHFRVKLFPGSAFDLVLLTDK